MTKKNYLISNKTEIKLDTLLYIYRNESEYIKIIRHENM